MSRGSQPTPFLLDLMAEWAGERDGYISRYVDNQQRDVAGSVRVPVMADAARGIADPDEKRRALAEAGMRERTRLDFAAFNHRLRQRLAPYTRTAARYRRGVFVSVALEIGIPESLLRFPGLGDDGDFENDGPAALPAPLLPRGPLGFGPAGAKPSAKGDKDA